MKIPENGWLVVCLAKNLYQTALPSVSALGAVCLEMAKEAQGDPVQVFELGQEVTVCMGVVDVIPVKP